MVQAVIATTVTGLQGRQVAATPAPTNNQALTWNGSAWVPGGPYLTAAGAPYIAENYVDNSGFSVNQRNYSSGTALAPGAFGFDRWKGGASGCTLTFAASPASTVVTISAGTLQQVIEGRNFINSSYTLSWLGSATGRVNNGTYVASPITFTGAPNTNVTIEFQGGTLGQVFLQLGTQATLWQPKTAEVELARCMRFFQSYPVLIAGPVGQTSGNNLVQPWVFPVIMRAAPTASYANQGLAGSLSTITVQSGAQNFASLSITCSSNLSWAFTATASYSADL